MSDEPEQKTEPTDKPNFKIARNGLEAANLTADAMGLADLTTVLTVVKMQTADGQMNIGSLSKLDSDEHLALMIEATQRFAQMTGVPLQMVYINEGDGTGGDN